MHSGLAYGAASDALSAFSAMRGGRPAREPECGESGGPALPTIVFHGDSDTTVHPRNGEQTFTARSTENGEESGRRYTRTTQPDASGRPALEHWLVHGAGHAWSGGSAKGSYADPRGPDATRAMVRFFIPSAGPASGPTH